MNIKDEFSKKIESLSFDQLKTIVQYLFDQSEYETKATANRTAEKMLRANVENNMQEDQLKQLKKEIERRLSNWQNKREDELWIKVFANEDDDDYDDWDDPDESEFYIEPAPGLVAGLESLLLDAETAGRNHWWLLSKIIMQAVYETPITVTGDDWDDMDALEYLEEYEWHDDLPKNTVEILLIQLLKDEQMEMDKKVDWMSDLIKIAQIEPSILESLRKTDPASPMPTEFLEAWLESIMSSDAFEVKEKYSAFLEAIALYENLKDGETLLWSYGKYAPEVYKKYYKDYFVEREPKQKIAYLKRALEKAELNNTQKAALLDELFIVYVEVDQIDLAQKAELEAFSYIPTYNRYKDMVEICPNQNYLTLFPSDWKTKMKMDAWLIEALEGKSKELINRLKNNKNEDVRKELTVLLGILCKGEMENKSLQELIIRFLYGQSYGYFYVSDEAIKTIHEHVFLFHRAFERSKWVEKDIRQLLNLALDCIDEYTSRILFSQARKEYFRCAQLIGVAKYAIEISGELNTFGAMSQRYEYEIHRFPRFKNEFNTWVI